MGIREPVITFDAGQTLVELDLEFLAARLAEEWGHRVDVAALHAALPGAWEEHDRQVAAGAGHPWRQLMTALLVGAGDPAAALHVEWLWGQQPTRNLFRKPIPAMVALARELAARGAIVAVLSNSEGKLAELLREVECAAPFRAIIDSGRLAFAKPDLRIFAHTLERLGLPADTVPIHIGDSYAADIVGARGAGWRAIWFHRTATPGGDPTAPPSGAAAGRGSATPGADPEIAIAHDAAAVRAALVRWGVL